MTDDILEDIWRLTRSELEDDYVGLWELIRDVRDRLPELDEDQVKSAVLAVVGRALDRQEARAGLGAVVGGLEHVWTEPVNQIVERIEREWNELGRDPLPGEIVWFDKPRLDPTVQSEVIANPSQTFTQPNGAQVFVQRVGDGYNVVMRRERGGNGNWKGISEATLNRIVRNLGWTRN